MGQLENRFFSKKSETIIKADDDSADMVCNVLKKALGRSNWIARGGRSSNYYFNFDKIYNQFSSNRK